MRKKTALLLSTVFCVVFLFPQCSKENENKHVSIEIAKQFGLAYAPIQIMEDLKLLEKRVPEADISWIQLSNTAAIREAMLGKGVDIGFMGIPPFLIGLDKGMEWKLFTGLSEMPVGLVTWREDIVSLKDFSEKEKIALPQPGSIQHILLSMAAGKILGDTAFFDNSLITMSHPDGMNALLTRTDVTAHFTSPPYLMQELDIPGMHLVLTGKEAVGSSFTFIAGSVTDKFSQKYPEIVNKIKEALQEAISFIKQEPGESVRILSEAYGIEEEDLRKYFSWEGIVYTEEITGLSSFTDFMYKQKYIDHPFEDLNQVLFQYEN